MKIVRRGRIAIKVNDETRPYFSTHACLRQGDPLSPLLFDIAVDGLALLIKKAQDKEWSLI